MDFALSSDQRQWQASLTGAMARGVPLSRARAFAADRETVARDVWKMLTEMGAAGLLIPQAHGGLGLTMLDAALTAEILGAHVAPAPFLGSAVLAPLALALAGDDAQKALWLPRLAAGEAIAGAALSEGIGGARGGAGVNAHKGRLDGRAMFVIDGLDADLLIVADGHAGLHLVDGRAPGVNIIDLPTIDRTRRVCEVTFEGARADALIQGEATRVLDRLRDAAWTILAADMLGASQAMLTRAVEYAKERRQFGRLIGSFQAVKHLCAEMAAEIEPSRALVWYAAYAWDAAPRDSALTAAHAKAHLSEVSRFVARTSTEVHGGIGITDLLGLHYWFKRVGLDRQLLGGPERVREIAASLQGFVTA